MKIRYIKLSQWILTSMLTIIGFSSCNDEPREEYGTPYATHSIKAKVTNSNQEAIPGIKVVATNSYRRIDSAFTDNEGKVNFSFSGFPGEEYILENKDVDGAENGNYENSFTEVSFKNAEYTGGDGWFRGQAEKSVDITMEEPETEN